MSIMLIVGSVLLGIAGLASFITFIMVLVKLFQQKGALHGILGIFCNLYPFIWGWIESTRLNLKKVMLIWTLSIVVAMVGYGMVIAGAVSMQPTTPPTDEITPLTPQP
jgi:hypothetical protein